MPFPNADSLWADVLAVRRQQPLVHNITNFVVMNYNANALLALGAAPVMAHAREEVRDMAGIAQALVLNIGTLSPEWIEAMIMALQTARGRGIPVVLDPVGAGATPYRNRAVAELLAAGSPTVLRGNASEILSVAGVEASTRGVDSAAASDDAVQTARTLAARLGAVVCVSGATDHILAPDGRHVRLSNGHVWMTRVTGVGCSAT
ncbi:hydroxyethylthiazole kinase, partial [Thiomonas arsenitoxydans]|uniref:hydroxyethylthiazole kinase n=1 Tax=Thiomonas arsenitoxydans (strain DSM 22701 / CIP 110005 / 3As) TaxID=426114 RepID=UPI001AC92C4A